MAKTFLIIQTAFIGDVILATSVLEKINRIDGAKIDILVRKGNETLFDQHPFIRNVLVWNKKESKYRELIRVLSEIKKNKYDVVINLQRFASTGFLTAFSGAKEKIGFNKNPFSLFFNRKIKHVVENGLHEIDRNDAAIKHLNDSKVLRPRLYPSSSDFSTIQKFKEKKYVTISPHSVWFTKTFPAYKWIELIQLINAKDKNIHIHLLGSKSEFEFSEYIRAKSGLSNSINLCGKLSFLESAALMKDAVMNYSNDSAPLHLASAMNAPVTAVYCSTVPAFGFGPLSDVSRIIETKLDLNCRPCGLHGYAECPLTHFKCAHSILIDETFLP